MKREHESVLDEETSKLMRDVIGLILKESYERKDIAIL